MTVGLVIVSHSARLAEGVVELVGQMVQQKTPLAAAGGAGDNVLGTSADTILAAIQAVDNPDGVLVLLDLGSAILSAEMALEMLDDVQRAHVLLSYAPLVEGAVTAALEASLGHTLAEVKRAAEKTAHVEQLQLLKPLDQPEEDEPTSTEVPVSVPLEASRETQLTLTNLAGLHARPAALFVQTVGCFQAHVQIFMAGKQVDASSITGILSLGARQGATIIVRANGTNADAALQALSDLVQANFYEAPPTTADVSFPSQPEMVRATAKSTGEIDGSWQGISTARGVAIGPALLYTSASIDLNTVESRTISPQQVSSEQASLRKVLETTAHELSGLAKQLGIDAGQAEAAIFEAQALMVVDPALKDAALEMIMQRRVDAATALARVGEQQARTLEQLGDELFAGRAADVRDVVGRALRSLRSYVVQTQDLSALSSPVILLAHSLTPSDTAQLRPATVLGICTTQGGPTAHAAILARALGIPALAGLSEGALQAIRPGDELALDADAGRLYLHPSAEVRAALASRLAVQQKQQAANKLAAQQTQEPVTFQGRRISLLANVGNEAEAEAARQWGAEGIGLLRTEFLFATSATLPDEDEQRMRYVKVFRAFKGDTVGRIGPIVVRTLDAGADKPLPALDVVLGSFVEANPALGLRGIRIHLAHQELLAQQLSALLQAAVEVDVELHIMFPMITTVEELRMARAIFDRVYVDLKQQGIAVPAHVPVGIMVEVPAAAIMAAELAELADFFSIGANDLLQYTVASDRTNAAVAYLYQSMQPAVLRLIRRIAEAGRLAGKAVAVCGEMAGDTRVAPLLMGMGVDELSMAPPSLPAVRAALMRTSARKLLETVERIGHLKTVGEVEEASGEL
jgi:phosphoenolpyruvate-protein phosphotransferase/dihydroxyacetone kinase phosphotransfer subunit